VGDAAVSLSLPGCETIWQETLAMADFDPAVLEGKLARNACLAYGLTLVADYPLPDDVLGGIERLRRVCRQALGDGVVLYPDEHLHLTVYSLLRSRTDLLPEDLLVTVWSRWLPRLQAVVGQLPSLAVPLKGLSITVNGAVLVCGAATDGLRWLQKQVSQLPGVAAPRDIPPHITIGQVRRPCGTPDAFDQAMAPLYHHVADPVGTLRSDRLRVLYYRSRLLDQVIQQAVIPLGQGG
jgi:2'-5' RNA ligase